MKEKTLDLDQMINEMDLSKLFDQTNETEKKEGITIWIPSEYKIKYDLIQGKSRRKFNGVIRTLLMRTIDKIDLR